MLTLALFVAPAIAQEEGFRGHGGPVQALAFAPDGEQAISSGFDQSAIVWDLKAGKARQILRVHEGSVNAVVALRDRRFLTAGEDGRVALWEAGSARPLRIDKAHDAPIAALAVSTDGVRYSTAGWDNLARVFSMADGALVETYEGHRGP